MLFTLSKLRFSQLDCSCRSFEGLVNNSHLFGFSKNLYRKKIMLSKTVTRKKGDQLNYGSLYIKFAMNHITIMRTN